MSKKVLNPTLTEIVFILDRSGSMARLVDDTIGGYNSFVENQKQVKGEARLTTVLFDDQYELLHNCVDIKKVKPMNRNEYSARGMTALLDAIGRTINTLKDRHMAMDNKPKVIFVITTDGQENSSKEFTQSQVKKMIEEQTSKYDWQFIFLGANIDAVSTAESYGIRGQFASSYSANTVGTDSLYSTMSCSVSEFRGKGAISTNWNSGIK